MDRLVRNKKASNLVFSSRQRLCGAKDTFDLLRMMVPGGLSPFIWPLEISKVTKSQDVKQAFMETIRYHGRQCQREEDPQMLIIGGSQSGLIVAARLKQMNIRSLVIDVQRRLGDTWRKRYNSLALQTTRMMDQFPYHSYPSNWPLHPPKERFANWIEYYADSQDLVVWTSTKPVADSKPVYDEGEKRWTVAVDRAGERKSIRPVHIVCCIGTVGKPFMPEVKNHDAFKDTIIHAHEYDAPAAYTGKHVVVVGAGNTAGDICIDLSTSANSTTMIQRSENCLVPIEVYRGRFNRSFPDDGSVPTEVGGGGESGQFGQMYKGLREKGMIVSTGENGEGPLFQVKVKHGVEVASFKEESIVLSDGSELPADAVIFATGYRPIHEEVVKIFGNKIAETAERFWGLDKGGEMIRVYRPSGYPALWYAGGGLQQARYGSKQIGLQIQAAKC